MIRVNLLPQEERITTSPVKIILAGVSALVCVVLLALYGYGYYCQYSLEKQMQDIRDRQTILEPVRVKMELANNKQGAIDKKTSILNTLNKDRKLWNTIVAHFSTLTPQKVWLTEFSFTDKETRIKGGAASYTDVASFLKMMETDTMLTEPVIDSTTKQEKGKAFNFDILVKVKGVQ